MVKETAGSCAFIAANFQVIITYISHLHGKSFYFAEASLSPSLMLLHLVTFVKGTCLSEIREKALCFMVEIQD